MLSDADGERAVHLARVAIERSLDVGAPRGSALPDDEGLPRAFHEARGVFVTLKQFPSGELRGCIGYPLPVAPLGTAIRDVAVAAATEDPRFPPVAPSEMDALTVEVSALTIPQVVPGSDPRAVAAAVVAGRDGLIIDGYGTSGLLLPQVATEQGWGAVELLEGTCQKAGLPPDAWQDRRVRVRRFEAEVFVETRPHGAVHREPFTPPIGRAAH